MKEQEGIWNKEYKFSSRNESRLQSLCDKLEHEDPNLNIWLPLLTRLKKEDECEFVSETNSTCDFITIIFNEHNKTDENGFQNYSQEVQSNNPQITEKPSSHQSALKKNKLSSKRNLVVSSQVSETKSKKLKLDDGDKSIDENFDNIRAEISVLKEKLSAQNAQLQSLHISQDEVAVFHKISPHQVNEICQELKLEELSELSLASICNAISVMDPPLSFTISVKIMQQSVYLQVVKMKSLSRVLMSAVLNYAEHHPKTITEGLIVPCIENKNFEASQVEILLKIIKEEIPDDYIPYLTKRILQVSAGYLEDHVITILNAATEKKVILGAECLELITKRLCDMTANFSQHLKFSKFLLSFISTYGNEMGKPQLSALSGVVQSNRTFLKRAAENVLKKLYS